VAAGGLRKVTPDGRISSISLPPDYGPIGLTVTSDDRVVLVSSNGDLLLLDPSGVLSQMSVSALAFGNQLLGEGRIEFYDLYDGIHSTPAAGPNGAIYVPDPFNHIIVAISPSGAVNRIAGRNHYGGDLGPAKLAILNNPKSIAAGPSGNIYVADNANYRIRKIDPSGTITTIIGNGVNEADMRENVRGVSMTITEPTALAVDAAENLYFADRDGSIRKMTREGIVTTLPESANTGLDILQMAASSTGNVYMCEFLFGTIFKYSAAGGLSVFARPGKSTRVIAVDSKDQVYVANTSGVVQRMAADGTTTTVAGGGSKPFQDGLKATEVTLGLVNGLAVDGANNLFITSYDVAYQVDLSGYIWRLTGCCAGGNWGDGGLSTKTGPVLATGVAVDRNGQVYFTDERAGRVRVLTPGLPPMRLLGTDAITGDFVSCTYPELQCKRDTFDIGPAKVGVFFRIQNLPPKSALRFRFVRPDSTTVYQSSFPSPNAELSDYNNYYYANISLDTPGRWSIIFDINGSTVASVPFTVLGPAVTSVVNAATLQAGAIAPNEYLTIFGAGLGPATGETQSLLTLASGTRIYVGGIPAPLTFTQDRQVNLVVPWGIPATSTTIQGEYNGVKGGLFPVLVAPSSPGIFTQNSAQAQAWVVNEDGTFNSASNPAPRNSNIAFWATGQGQVDGAQQDGKQPTGPPFPNPKLPVTVSLGGVTLPDSNITFKGLLYTGVVQINVLIPADAPTGSSVPLRLSIGGATSPSSVTMAIR
jgi:uncharacterized protein (TIGR03437 family)